MLIIDNKEIDTPIEDIVLKLRDTLHSKYIYLLEKCEVQGDNLRVTCPMHKGGQERTPSCDILLKDKIHKGKIVVAGTVNCFGCGYKTNLVKFIADCFDTSYLKAKEWLLNNFEYSIVKNNRVIEDLDDDIEVKTAVDLPEVSIEELKKYEYIHPYMFERNLNDYIINKFEIGYDPKTDCLTFPVYIDGICRYVFRRHTKYKMFRMPKMEEKPIYGLDYITSKEIVVCESILDCLVAWKYGKQAIALLGTGSEDNYKILNSLNIRSYILMFDNDEAGRIGAYKFKKNVTNGLITDIIMPKGKDVNDLTEEEFNSLLENSI